MADFHFSPAAPEYRERILKNKKLRPKIGQVSLQVIIRLSFSISWLPEDPEQGLVCLDCSVSQCKSLQIKKFKYLKEHLPNIEMSVQITGKLKFYRRTPEYIYVVMIIQLVCKRLHQSCMSIALKKQVYFSLIRAGIQPEM